MVESYKTVVPFGDGDLRLSPERGSLGSYDLLQQSFYGIAAPVEESLPHALQKGMGVYFKTNFSVPVTWKVKVSDFVRRKLKLKSTTIGAKTFAAPGGGAQRVPLTAAARKALKRYKRVSGTVEAVATDGPLGAVISKKKMFTLKTPDSGLG
jgi:hypothetical protein